MKFRPRARLLRLLGDQLIAHPRLAVFELVKNSYDANAKSVTIIMEDLEGTHPRIIVEDDGDGMDEQTLENYWFQPGSDHRAIERKEKIANETTGRLPLGEKGVGRFAVDKLGQHINLFTKKLGQPELAIKIDWEELNKHDFLEDADISVSPSLEEHFTEKGKGTRIEITGLNDQWTYGEIRRLFRSITSISSPFKKQSDFQVKYELPQQEKWLEGLLTTEEILKWAMWVYKFTFQDGVFSWEYSFKPLEGIKLESKTEKKNDDVLKLSKLDSKKERFGVKIAPAEFGKGVGKVAGTFYAYDRTKDVLSLLTETNALKNYLDDNGGVRVYRDGIRVYNYGERQEGDDWLGLDLRRVNIPARRLSNNILLGHVDISLEDSVDLKEKTNREGFVENEALQRFRAIVLAALIHFETKREFDKKEIKKLLDTTSSHTALDIQEPLQELKLQIKRKKLEASLGKYVTAVERRYEEMKEVMTQSGISGLNLATLFHEMERGVRVLTNSIIKKKSRDELQSQAVHLRDLLDGFSSLMRKKKKAKYSIKEIVSESLALNASRFTVHETIVSSPLVNENKADFEVLASMGMVLGAISNIIDNSIYWLQVKWPSPQTPGKRAIYIGTSDYFEEGPALIIADNGPGFNLSSADITTPFLSLKPDGMGLGMYYSNLVMQLQGGKVEFPNPVDVGVPEAYTGAVVALVFPKVPNDK